MKLTKQMLCLGLVMFLKWAGWPFCEDFVLKINLCQKDL